MLIVLCLATILSRDLKCIRGLSLQRVSLKNLKSLKIDLWKYVLEVSSKYLTVSYYFVYQSGRVFAGMVLTPRQHFNNMNGLDWAGKLVINVLEWPENCSVHFYFGCEPGNYHIVGAVKYVNDKQLAKHQHEKIEKHFSLKIWREMFGRGRIKEQWTGRI